MESKGGENARTCWVHINLAGNEVKIRSDKGEKIIFVIKDNRRVFRLAYLKKAEMWGTNSVKNNKKNIGDVTKNE